MTDIQISVTIGEACGFVRDSGFTEYDGTKIPWTVWHRNGKVYNQTPDYANDLNAIASAVKTIPDEQYDGEDGFTANLTRITHGEKALVNGWLFRPMQEATARQRAEAFLRTIGKWKE